MEKNISEIIKFDKTDLENLNYNHSNINKKEIKL